jgi:hypothetical protein
VKDTKFWQIEQRLDKMGVHGQGSFGSGLRLTLPEFAKESCCCQGTPLPFIYKQLI